MTNGRDLDAELARVRRRIDHPVIDADGHLIEVMPLIRDILRDIADPQVAARYGSFHGYRAGDGFLPTRVFRAYPSENTLDRMTATVPRLLHRRLEQVGIDFALAYPSSGLMVMALPDDEVRQAACKAHNIYYAEVFAGLRDRVEPVAVIPMGSPAEALAELDHAVGTLGLKAIVMPGVLPRKVRPDGTEALWYDTLGHGSLYDYDPVWQRCQDLGVAPAFHGLGYGWNTRTSVTNYVFNHLGSFGVAQESVCRSLLMGGVVRRFPKLRFGFLEGGVAWAAQLYADLLGHYEKRNVDAVDRLDPRRLDVDLAMNLYREYAHGRLAERADRVARTLATQRDAPPDANVDDFLEAGFTGEDDIVAGFRDQLFFGCEADDAMNSLAFDRKVLPHGICLNAMFASDIGHWDVTDIREVLPEAWALVERGHIGEAQFRDFAGGNVARMLQAVNPSFFAGTAVETAITKFA